MQSVLPSHAAPTAVLPSAPQNATPTAANPSEPVTLRRSPRLAVACLSVGVPIALVSAGAFPPSFSPACSSSITGSSLPLLPTSSYPTNHHLFPHITPLRLLSPANCAALASFSPDRVASSGLSLSYSPVPFPTASSLPDFSLLDKNAIFRLTNQPEFSLPPKFSLTNHRLPFCGLFAQPSPSLSPEFLSPPLLPFSMPYVPGPSVRTAGVSLSCGSSSLFRSSFALSVALASPTPVLNLDHTGKPLTFRSALAGPFGPQWALSDGVELAKLVSITRTLPRLLLHLLPDLL